MRIDEKIDQYLVNESKNEEFTSDEKKWLESYMKSYKFQKVGNPKGLRFIRQESNTTTTIDLYKSRPYKDGDAVISMVKTIEKKIEDSISYDDMNRDDWKGSDANIIGLKGAVHTWLSTPHFMSDDI